MKRNFGKAALAMVMSASLMMMAACGTPAADADTTAAPETTAAEETSAEETSADAPEADTTAEGAESAAGEGDVDFSAYPEDFSAWTMNDMKNYLTACELNTNEDFFGLDMSEGDLSAMNATAGYVYVDVNGGSVVDNFCFFDANDDAAKVMLDFIYENKAIVVDGDVENGITMDAVLGGFAVSYLMGTDEEHIAALAQALNDLVAHYNIQDAYVNE